MVQRGVHDFSRRDMYICAWLRRLVCGAGNWAAATGSCNCTTKRLVSVVGLYAVQNLVCSFLWHDRATSAAKDDTWARHSGVACTAPRDVTEWVRRLAGARCASRWAGCLVVEASEVVAAAVTHCCSCDPLTLWPQHISSAIVDLLQAELACCRLGSAVCQLCAPASGSRVRRCPTVDHRRTHLTSGTC
jgi:hypothetical protein